MDYLTQFMHKRVDYTELFQKGYRYQSFHGYHRSSEYLVVFDNDYNQILTFVLRGEPFQKVVDIMLPPNDNNTEIFKDFNKIKTFNMFCFKFRSYLMRVEDYTSKTTHQANCKVIIDDMRYIVIFKSSLTKKGDGKNSGNFYKINTTGMDIMF